MDRFFFLQRKNLLVKILLVKDEQIHSSFDIAVIQVGCDILQIEALILQSTDFTQKRYLVNGIKAVAVFIRIYRFENVVFVVVNQGLSADMTYFCHFADG